MRKLSLEVAATAVRKCKMHITNGKIFLVLDTKNTGGGGGGAEVLSQSFLMSTMDED
jgi:hypothetical protein